MQWRRDCRAFRTNRHKESGPRTLFRSRLHMQRYAWAVLGLGLGLAVAGGQPGWGQGASPLACGHPAGCSYAAYWDGSVLNTGQEAASGVYIYQLTVDGRRFTRKMVVMK